MLLTNDEWQEIVERLDELTIAENVTWRKEENGFSVSVGRTKYLLGSIDEDEVAPFFLGIETDGREYDRYEQPPARTSGPDAVRGALSKLQRNVNRQHHRTPDRVRSFLEELGSVSTEAF